MNSRHYIKRCFIQTIARMSLSVDDCFTSYFMTEKYYYLMCFNKNSCNCTRDENIFTKALVLSSTEPFLGFINSRPITLKKKKLPSQTTSLFLFHAST